MNLARPLWIAVLHLACAVPLLTADDQDPALQFPPRAAPGAPGYLSSAFIYPLDDKPTPSCHAPTLAELESGLAAAWFGGAREGAADVGIWFARLEDGNWTRPVEVANGVQSPEQRFPCWNPVLFKTAGGPLLLFYKVGPRPHSWWGMLMTSADGGRSWSQPWRLGADEKIGHLIGPVKNKPLRLADGAILCPSSTEHDGWRVHFELTRDLGKTWEVLGPINDGREFAAIQPSILTYPGGKMQALCRSKQQVIAQSWSEDGGRTWSKLTALELPNPNSGVDAVTLHDGRQLLVYNHATRLTNEFPKGRDVLNVALSDDGLRWTPVLTLEHDPRAQFAYPAVIQTRDGKVHVAYTWKRLSIRHAVLEPDKLTTP